MELKHHFVVPSSLEDTWHSFNQLEDIAPCFPGATLTSVSGDEFTGTVKVKLGPIAMIYTGTGEFLERNQDTHTVVISATGKDKRGNGTAGATVTAVLAVLAPDGDGTSVDVTTDMNVTGKPAQFGRGVIQDISDKLLAQFVQCVIGKVGDGAARAVEPASAGPTVRGPAAPGPAEPAGPGLAGPGPAGLGPAEPAEPASAGPAAPAAQSPAAPAPTTPSAPASELDLGSAAWPVLVRRFGPAVLCAAAVLALVVWLVRRPSKG